MGASRKAGSGQQMLQPTPNSGWGEGLVLVCALMTLCTSSSSPTQRLLKESTLNSSPAHFCFLSPSRNKHNEE